MSENIDDRWFARATTMISKLVESILLLARHDLNTNPAEINRAESPLSSSNQSRDFRRIQIPQTRVGLASNEADLIILFRKYLEMVGLVFFVWLFGYFHFSVSWILLAVFIYLFRQRQRTQFKERHRMLTEMNNNEEGYIKARLDELPSWVFFPDVERAEWVNRIIKQAWPYANKFLERVVFRESIVASIKNSSPALADFTFQRLDLGETPPRIGGIKVYQENVRDQIMMDVEVFYAGDARIKTKVKGIVCGIKDIQFVGELRIVLTPLIDTIPLAGAVVYYFLRNPSIDFKLTDAGTLVDIPGINDALLARIRDIVGSMMVAPNRQVFPLLNDIPTGYLKWSIPQGVVRVFLIKARDLIKADINFLGAGKSDPFVRARVHGDVKYKTKTIKNTTEPEWNEVFEFVVEQYESEVIEFEVFDEDPGTDDFIGRAEFPVNALIGTDAIDTWLTLKDVKKGSLNVRLQYFTLSNERESLYSIERINNQSIKRDKLSQALLICFIDRCTNLPSSKKSRREPNPFCRIRVDSQERRTPIFESKTDPRFEHSSQIFCANPLHQKLSIEVLDARSNNELIGFFEIPIKQIYDSQAMTIDTQAFPLRNVSEPLDRANIVLRLSLFILTVEQSPQRFPSPTSPSLSSSFSFDSNLPSPTESLRSPLVDLVEEKTLSRTGSKKQTALSSINGEANESMLICDDPDMKTNPYGRIKIGIRYSLEEKMLSVTVYSCRNLINVHSQNLPDPYIRACLMPDFRKDKHKTKSIHDTVNPVFDHNFQWSASLAEIKHQRLFISIKNNSPLFKKEQIYMGDLQIDLSNLDPQKNSIAWYSLQEPNTSAAGMIKIKYGATELNENQSES